ncbi:integrin beta-7 [Malaclemys terrapin pileata]|uniref:integrin beta-7 n=1 Tax=Malaclemys terrapin pileata TaxID=2991368 RepID=UPI0023A89175|nr:integrin beta-7 [Malaclemys terrapin pileata]
MKGTGLVVGLGLLLAVGQGEKTLEAGSCRPRASCRDCIRSQPSCAWCKALDFTKTGESDATRCATREELLRRGCALEEVVEPRGRHQVLEDAPLSDSAEQETVTQLAPQKIALWLRPGEQHSFSVRFKRAEGYPVDVYYLMDLSYSMKDDLENIKKLGNDLLAALRNITKSVKIGFGSFVDKTVLPYVSTVPAKLRNPCPDRHEQCDSPVSFHHVLPLTDNASEFESRVSQQRISGNLDSPEGGFDAIMQAAVCEEQIGWRNVTRLLVFTSDDVFHTAGDGKLGGIYLPNDNQCHLDTDGLYSKSHIYDYPSVGHLAQVLSASNIQPIFAVTGSTLPVYQELSRLIPKSVVGELKEDSSNVVQLISDAYNSLSSTVNLEHFQLPPGVSVAYKSHCKDATDSLGIHGGVCSGVHINQLVSFTVTVQADACLEGLHTFALRVLGFTEEVRVELQTLCECPCSQPEPNATHCSGGHGTLTCGVCSCSPGRVGKLCECELAEAMDLDAGCRGRNGTGPTCSGKGQCVCGQCQCNSNVRGQHCECDDTSCERHDGQLCAGQGRCQCGSCMCNEGYTGSACDCSLDTRACLQDGVECSGHGRCVCNKCQCQPGYFDRLCSRCTNCRTPCEEHRDCADCQAFRMGPLSQNCSIACNHTVATVVPEATVNEQWCKEKTDDGRILIFLIEGTEGGKVALKVKDKDAVTDQTSMIVLGSVLGIVVIGLLVVIAYRISVEILDRREYMRFEKERERAKGNEVNNPLYQSATTTVINPRYNED